jgi:outer membrane lipoprotein-sorting protein
MATMKLNMLRTTIFVLGIFVWANAAPTHALTDAEAAAIEKAENYINDIATMQARFLQTNPDGGTLEGDLFIARPGKMRLVYDPPTPMLLVADGVFLIYVDTEMNDASHINLEDTPAGLLLKENLSFTDADVRLGEVKLGASTVEVTTSMANDPAAGTLTLVFSDAPFELRQWRVVDAQNKEVAVSLFDAKRGVKLDKSLFRYDARRAAGERD